MAPPQTKGGRQLIAAYYSFDYRKRMKGWVGLLGWPIVDGFTHISGHPSAAGQAQWRESSPVEDQHSTTVSHNQLQEDQQINSNHRQDFMPDALPVAILPINPT